MRYPQMKRFTVTLADSVFAELQEWADSEGRPTANLAAFLIEQSIRKQRQPKPVASLTANDEGSDRT
jgi:hypothetical protein